MISIKISSLSPAVCQGRRKSVSIFSRNYRFLETNICNPQNPLGFHVMMIHIMSKYKLRTPNVSLKYVNSIIADTTH